MGDGEKYGPTSVSPGNSNLSRSKNPPCLLPIENYGPILKPLDSPVKIYGQILRVAMVYRLWRISVAGFLIHETLQHTQQFLSGGVWFRELPVPERVSPQRNEQG